jgi:hypothetical protein
MCGTRWRRGRQNARDALAVEIDQLIVAPVDA